MTLSLFRPGARKVTAAVLLMTWLAPLPLPVLAQPASAPAAPVRPNLDVGSAAAADQVQSNLNRSVQIGRQSPYLQKETTIIDAPTYELPDMGDPSTAALSPEMERRLGDRVMRQIRRDPDYVPDPLLSDYLNDIGYRLIESARRQHVAGSTSASSFELFAVRDPGINAFALPGGYIGVNTGTLVATDSESELASVLGHEIGHVLQRHIARGIDKSGESMWIALASILLAGLAATKSGDAAQALAVGGQAAAVSNQLAFSRGAEREADRVGFTLLTGAGYNPDGMPDFFRRLQRVTSIADTGIVPGYARTHPLTGERIADMEDRARGLPHPLQPHRPEFGFAKARARVLQEMSTSAYLDVRNAMRSQLTSAPDAPVERRAALWYGIAVAEQMAGQLDAAEQALLEARRLYGNIPGITSGSPNLDVTAIELARAHHRVPEALTMARAALTAYPMSRAVGITYAQTLLAAGRVDDAIPYLRDKAREDTAQPIWWDLLAHAYADQGKRVEQHRALAEKYARDGAWGAAVEQLKLARDAGDADFYTLSEVDARLHQMERQYREEKQEEKALPK
ncbi:M48 family metallopeptidase [Ralstonia solanacearum]|uniref:beta-barrel assembly-enhancing protease n=1 Tax=Ralstonia solanacearum TaxID=305 RepID=UPI0005C6D9BA|nr:M48 family metallopeptidase [Ralstonia solanacearum]MBB6591970.1 M48 family metallopeptidase [Ralstonia solanacearum]MBB6596193.1 M48 family metallopeptidase [Ralstonia solanacearum]MDB0542973.1 M48 family metallopeptidase [Ralstonia solanacearum]MDB0553196.1 M48 family metallopeptidase [Ralstonia solanacearum]MDB0557979.1 M48 family metallopeptidase [Ralstonia solanacearum]